MEKEEVYSLRDALDTMDIAAQQKAEEARIQAAAQQEASELVFAHQNPEAVRLRKEEEERIRMTGYRYRDHLRKGSYAHARAASVGPEYFGEDAIIVDLGPPRSMSRTSMRSEDSHDMAPPKRPGIDGRISSDDGRGRDRQKNYGGLAGAVSAATSRKWSMRRRSSSNRNISGEVGKVFSPDQIWEEPESNETSRERKKKSDANDDVAVLSPLKTKAKNPLNRVQFAGSSENTSASPEKTPVTPIKPLSRTEIYRNPPSQSRNPAYTSTPPGRSPSPEKMAEVPMKDGKEIRNEELRMATSKKRDERSEKLPMPVAVSDKPGRPILPVQMLDEGSLSSPNLVGMGEGGLPSVVLEREKERSRSRSVTPRTREQREKQRRELRPEVQELQRVRDEKDEKRGRRRSVRDTLKMLAVTPLRGMSRRRQESEVT